MSFEDKHYAPHLGAAALLTLLIFLLFSELTLLKSDCSLLK